MNATFYSSTANVKLIKKSFFFFRIYKTGNLTLKRKLDKFGLWHRRYVLKVNFYDLLNEIKTTVRQELKLGASIQSVVENHLLDIQSLLRKRNERKSGPFSVKQLAEHFGIGYFALRTSIQRSANKTNEKNIHRVKPTKLSEKKNEVLKSSKECKHNLVGSDDVVIVRINQISEEDVKTICLGNEFLLELESSSDFLKMILREENSTFLVFDAYARSGKSALSKIIKFNKHTSLFE